MPDVPDTPLPFRLRSALAAPAGWPPDVLPNQIITAAHINAIRSSAYAWPGDVDGQFHTLRNVNLVGVTGVLADPTTTAGDLIARDAATIGRFPIGAAGQVLTVDTAQPAKMRWVTPATAPVVSVFGRVGAVVAQAGDYTAAMVTGALADPLTTKGDLVARGAVTGRMPVGLDGQVLRVDSAQTFGLRWSGESVPSVFGRTGPIAAQSGDYTAAMVSNAVSSLGSYPDPAWIPSLSWLKLIGTPATFPPGAHTHDAAAIVSGVLATARLGTGVADATVYLRGDGTWAGAGTGGGGGVISVFGRAGNVIAQAGDYTAAMVTGAVTDPTAIRGDLIVRNDLNALVRLPLGASGQVLQADNTLSTGMKWTTLGAAVQTPWVTDIDAANFQLVNLRRLGVAVALPAYPVDVSGDINYTGTLRKNGVPVTFGGSQTPWTSDIDAAGFALNNAGKLGIGTAGPILPLTILQAPQEPSLTANAGMFMMYGNSGITLAAGVGTAQIWMQGKFSANDGRTFPISMQPLGGNVGIGTASPGNALTVLGTSATPSFRAATGNPGYYWDFGRENATTGDFVFNNANGSGSVERMRITAAGSVGIAVSTPGNVRLFVAGVDAAPGTGVSSFVVSAASTNFQLRMGYSQSNNYGFISASDSSVFTPLILNGAGGPVGIGITTPSERLTVYGTAVNPSNTGGVFPALIGVRGDTNVQMDFGQFPASPFGAYIQVRHVTATGLAWPLALNPLGGFVGIAKATPGYALDVAGDINCTGTFRVGGTPIGNPTAFTTGASTNMALTGTVTDVPGASITLSIAGLFLVLATCHFQAASGDPTVNAIAVFNVAGVTQPFNMWWAPGSTGGSEGVSTGHMIIRQNAGDVLKLQAWKTGSAGATLTNQTVLSAIWLKP